MSMTFAASDFRVESGLVMTTGAATQSLRAPHPSFLGVGPPVVSIAYSFAGETQSASQRRYADEPATIGRAMNSAMS